MNTLPRLLLGLAVLVVLAAGWTWLVHRQAKTSADDPIVVWLKWGLTLGILTASIIAIPVFGLFGILLIVFSSVIFAVLWAPELGERIARPITNAFDGGRMPPERKPAYSQAEARRKRGDFRGAAAELRQQLTEFPSDYDAQMMLAAVQAENLADLEGARMTIERIVHQREHGASRIAYALTQLADWELSRNNAPEAARQIFERLQQLFPGTEIATRAAQRIAHLPVLDADAGAFVTRAATLQTGDEIEGLTRHLAAHPQDLDARTELIRALLTQNQPDAALQQIQWIVSQPNLSSKEFARWQNQAAEIHLRHRHDLVSACQSLQSVIDRLPGSAFAEAAASRQEMMTVETPKNKTSRTVKLGSYEDDLGLKG